MHRPAPVDAPFNSEQSGRARGISLVKAATLAVVGKEVVANVGWQALVELGVALS